MKPIMCLIGLVAILGIGFDDTTKVPEDCMFINGVVRFTNKEFVVITQKVNEKTQYGITTSDEINFIMHNRDDEVNFTELEEDKRYTFKGYFRKVDKEFSGSDNLLFEYYLFFHVVEILQ